jgi:N utilization substance protein B
MNDFRIDSFEKVFAASLDEIEKIDRNFTELSDNQRLRAQQLLQNTQDNKERIENSIRTYSENWSYERIGKVEIIILSLGISELIMDLTPKKVIISEWVKLCDKHSSSQSAKFVNGILNTISENINNE